MKNALILAGGKSSRMGTDKALLPFYAHKTLTHFLFSRLNHIFDHVFVSTKDEKFAKFANLPLVKDAFDAQTPLCALATLERYFTTPVFVIAVDTPLVSSQTISTLYANLQKNKICVASSGGHTHWLCGFYDPSVSPVALSLISQGVYKVGALHKFCATKVVNFSQNEEFLNANTPDDLRKLHEKTAIFADF